MDDLFVQFADSLWKVIHEIDNPLFYLLIVFLIREMCQSFIK